MASSSPISYLQFIVDKEMSSSFGEFEVLLHIFIMFPIGISSAERSFSILHHIKNYLHSAMEQKHISDLALLAIEWEAAQQLDISSIIKHFTGYKVLRGCLLTTA